ncbi:hypothetical protein NHF48_002775 [Sphingomonas sp. H160509]|uniref:hypothetical protein n=1 Tax=Sphingomonas sp. H160509 TaxID=2955313 RepID=UPI00209831DD|nr:hypothetical protein [Sphingomonas sp. H160509]MDD1450130.1 hypothetical protein [Sphingomonas sp. H160509]
MVIRFRQRIASRWPTIGPPRSFPAILLALLHRRWRFGGAGVTFLPCELVAGNGQTPARGSARSRGAVAAAASIR